MFAVRRLVALRPLAILTMLAMLMFATIAEAATCTPELEFSSAMEAPLSPSVDEADGGDEDQKGSTSREQHGVCAHGHCHHSSNLTDPSSLRDDLRSAVLHTPVTAVQLASLQRGILSPPTRA